MVFNCYSKSKMRVIKRQYGVFGCKITSMWRILVLLNRKFDFLPHVRIKIFNTNFYYLSNKKSNDVHKTIFINIVIYGLNDS